MSLEFDDFENEYSADDEQALGVSDVTAFLRNFREAYPHDAPKEDITLVTSALNLLDLASARDVVIDQASPSKLPFLSTILPPRGGVVFATGRENWAQRIDAPTFIGGKTEGSMQIRIKSNSDAGSRFNFELLEETGIYEVTISSSGLVRAYSFDSVRSLKKIEKLELADYIDMARDRLVRTIDLESRFSIEQ